MLSYTFNDAKGNTNSDSNADFQGDWIALDPRAPNAWGPQPGNIKHQFKAFGSYSWDSGLELSGVFNWNSGMLYSRAQLISGRFLPIMDEVDHGVTPDNPDGNGYPGYEFGGVYDTWILPGSVGSETGPSYYTFDLRARYIRELPTGQLEFFVDVLNVLNKQLAISQMALVNGNGTYAFGEDNAWVEPRRAYLGVRYSF